MSTESSELSDHFGASDRAVAAQRISVIGTGYLGATHAICMAVVGHEVVGVDVDPRRSAG